MYLEFRRLLADLESVLKQLDVFAGRTTFFDLGNIMEAPKSSSARERESQINSQKRRLRESSVTAYGDFDC